MNSNMPIPSQVSEYPITEPHAASSKFGTLKGLLHRLNFSRIKFFSVLTLLVAGITSWWLLNSSPVPESETNTVPPPLVEVVDIRLGRSPINVTGYGTVVAAREVSVSPQVEGVVVAASPNVEIGGRVMRGEILFRIDPRDFELAVTQAESLVARAEVELSLQTAEAEIAQQDFQDLFPDMSSDDIAPLALREPQRRRAALDLEAARSQLAEARLGLTRTVVRAPFNASVVEEDIEIGGRLAPEMTPLRLVGDEEYRVIASVPLSALASLTNTSGRSVEILIDPGTTSETRRVGRFVRQLATVDPDGRLGRILVAVKDPLGARNGPPRLTLGSYAQVSVDAGTIDDVVRIPPDALRENGQVWVRDADGQLQYRSAAVRWRAPDHLLAEIETEEGDELITSYLNDPLPGQMVRVSSETSDD